MPVSIAPNNIQAIISGNGKNSGEIKYIKGNFLNLIEGQNILTWNRIYLQKWHTIGTVEVLKDKGQKILKVNFIVILINLNIFAEVLSEKLNVLNDK